jgi:hypothetical protein
VERDQVIRLTGAGAADKCPHELRRVEVYDPDKDETLVFLTNPYCPKTHPMLRLRGGSSATAPLAGPDSVPGSRQRPRLPG